MDELFNIPKSEPSLLERARKRYFEAMSLYEKCVDDSEDYGDPIPPHVSQELYDARINLANIESYEHKTQNIRPQGQA